MTVLDSRGVPDLSRFTEYMRYPLPPHLPREENSPETDRYHRYRLPSPTTGRITAYTRATKIADTISDDGALSKWKIREKVSSILLSQRLAETINDSMTDIEMALATSFREYERLIRDEAKVDEINSVIDRIHDMAGGADARELGQAVHDWLGELDMNRLLRSQLPDFIQPYAESYTNALAQAGLVAVPEYTERVVLNDRGVESIAGRLDRIYRVVETGELILGDLKTSKSNRLDTSKDKWAIQMAVYGYATKMLNLDGLTWSDMPPINQDYCVVVHLPSDQPERAAVVPFDLYVGGEGMVLALDVRAKRREIKSKVLAATHETPSEGSCRLVQARQALQSIKVAEDASTVFEQYEDVWNDDLTQLGQSCIELLTATTEKEN